MVFPSFVSLQQQSVVGVAEVAPNGIVLLLGRVFRSYWKIFVMAWVVQPQLSPQVILEHITVFNIHLLLSVYFYDSVDVFYKLRLKHGF